MKEHLRLLVKPWWFWKDINVALKKCSLSLNHSQKSFWWTQGHSLKMNDSIVSILPIKILFSCKSAFSSKSPKWIAGWNEVSFCLFYDFIPVNQTSWLQGTVLVSSNNIYLETICLQRLYCQIKLLFCSHIWSMDSFAENEQLGRKKWYCRLYMWSNI